MTEMNTCSLDQGVSQACIRSKQIYRDQIIPALHVNRTQGQARHIRKISESMRIERAGNIAEVICQLGQLRQEPTAMFNRLHFYFEWNECFHG